VSYQKWKIKRSIFGIFCFFITEKVRKGKNAVQARKKLCEVYGEDVNVTRTPEN